MKRTNILYLRKVAVHAGNEFWVRQEIKYTKSNISLTLLTKSTQPYFTKDIGTNQQIKNITKLKIKKMTNPNHGSHLMFLATLETQVNPVVSVK